MLPIACCVVVTACDSYTLVLHYNIRLPKGVTGMSCRLGVVLGSQHTMHYITSCHVVSCQSTTLPMSTHHTPPHYIIHITSRYITACCIITCCPFTKAFALDVILLCQNRGAARRQMCGFDWKHGPCKIYQTTLMDRDSSFWTCHIDNSFLCLMLQCSCCSLRSQCNSR